LPHTDLPHEKKKEGKKEKNTRRSIGHHGSNLVLIVAPAQTEAMLSHNRARDEKI
jgi:hypothetical protein